MEDEDWATQPNRQDDPNRSDSPTNVFLMNNGDNQPTFSKSPKKTWARQRFHDENQVDFSSSMIGLDNDQDFFPSAQFTSNTDVPKRVTLLQSPSPTILSHNQQQKTQLDSGSMVFPDLPNIPQLNTPSRSMDNRDFVASLTKNPHRRVINLDKDRSPPRTGGFATQQHTITITNANNAQNHQLPNTDRVHLGYVGFCLQKPEEYAKFLQKNPNGDDNVFLQDIFSRVKLPRSMPNVFGGEGWEISRSYKAATINSHIGCNSHRKLGEAPSLPIICRVSLASARFRSALKVIDGNGFANIMQTSSSNTIMAQLIELFGGEMREPILFTKSFVYAPSEMFSGRDEECRGADVTHTDFINVQDNWFDPNWQSNWHVLTVEQAAKQRVVVIGDLHGDAEQTIRVLKLMRIIDSNKNWVAGNAILVQLGDMIDRGPNSRQVVQLFEFLKQQAPGHVFTLNGNHEVGSLMSDGAMEQYFQNRDVQKEFRGDLPRRIQAYRPDGDVGRLLINNPIVLRIQAGSDSPIVVKKSGSKVKKSANAEYPILGFAHGDLAPEFAQEGVDMLNMAAHKEIYKYASQSGAPDFKKFQLDKSDVIINGRGPNQFREISDPHSVGFMEDRQAEDPCEISAKTLEAFNVWRFQHDITYIYKLGSSFFRRAY